MSEVNPILWNLVIKYLSFRPRSKAEVETYLAKKNANPEEIRLIMLKLVSYNFVDDIQFCNWFVEGRFKAGRGRNLVYRELLQKGIDKQLTKEVLSDNSPIEANSILELAGKYLIKYSHKTKPEIKNKLLSALLRRGFDYDLTCSTVEKVLKKSKI